MCFENGIKNSPDYSLRFIHNRFIYTLDEYFLIIAYIMDMFNVNN